MVRTFVSETEELVRVTLRGEEILCTPGHPFYSPVKGWTEACRLRAGDILVLVNGEYVVVEQVQHELLEVPVQVYNLEVEDFHTYFVSEAAVLVHNRCDVPKNSVAMNTDDALDTAEDYLGPGYKEVGTNSGRYVSSDGLRQVRMGLNDITGAHAGGPHMNFDVLGPGRYVTYHIFLLE